MEMGIKIDTEKDIVCYKGKPVKPDNRKIYIMLNKPEGYVSTVKEQFNRPKVTDLIKSINVRLYPVGRLDYDSSGLIILTNDGDLTYNLTHPGHEVDKTYTALVKGVPDKDKIETLKTGTDIGGFITSPAEVSLLGIKGDKSIIKITIHEGKYRQVRRMLSAVGHEVLKLKRISIGNLPLGDLKKGEWRFLTESEIQYLKSL
jgi:pseudouridine synthase